MTLCYCMGLIKLCSCLKKWTEVMSPGKKRKMPLLELHLLSAQINVHSTGTQAGK